MATIELREANFSDAMAIAQLHAASWRQTYRGIYSDAFLNNEVEEDRAAVWRNRLSTPHPKQQVIVATLDNRIIGFACIFLDDDPEYGTLLDNLHISSQWQHSGIGKRLLQECAARICKHSSSPDMYLWVYESNEKARRVYERLGAIHVETVEQPTASGIPAQSCRYAWPDVAVLLP